MEEEKENIRDLWVRMQTPDWALAHTGKSGHWAELRYTSQADILSSSLLGDGRTARAQR